MALVVLGLAWAGAVRADDLPGTPYVVVVGIDKYADPQILPRKHAESDAKALHDLLTSKDHLGVDLVGKPNLALQAAIAIRILFGGMEIGTFTGKKFADYFSGARADWVNARRIVNGTDKASLIASYGQKYYAAISYTV